MFAEKVDLFSTEGVTLSGALAKTVNGRRSGEALLLKRTEGARAQA